MMGGGGDSRRRGVRKSKLPRLPNADFCRMPPGTHAIFLSLAFAKSSFAMPKSSLAMRRQILAGEPVRQKKYPALSNGIFCSLKRTRGAKSAGWFRCRPFRAGRPPTMPGDPTEVRSFRRVRDIFSSFRRRTNTPQETPAMTSKSIRETFSCSRPRVTIGVNLVLKFRSQGCRRSGTALDRCPRKIRR